MHETAKLLSFFMEFNGDHIYMYCSQKQTHLMSFDSYCTTATGFNYFWLFEVTRNYLVFLLKKQKKNCLAIFCLISQLSVFYTFCFLEVPIITLFLLKFYIFSHRRLSFLYLINTRNIITALLV